MQTSYATRFSDLNASTPTLSPFSVPPFCPETRALDRWCLVQPTRSPRVKGLWTGPGVEHHRNLARTSERGHTRLGAAALITPWRSATTPVLRQASEAGRSCMAPHAHLRARGSQEGDLRCVAVGCLAPARAAGVMRRPESRAVIAAVLSQHLLFSLLRFLSLSSSLGLHWSPTFALGHVPCSGLGGHVRRGLAWGSYRTEGKPNGTRRKGKGLFSRPAITRTVRALGALRYMRIRRAWPSGSEGSGGGGQGQGRRSTDRRKAAHRQLQPRSRMAVT